MFEVLSKNVATLFRERDDYVLKYHRDATTNDFVSLTMPVREEAWRWPRDLHPFFRQNLTEGYLLNLIREQFGPLLDGTNLSMLAARCRQANAACVGRRHDVLEVAEEERAIQRT